jgi:hypothetical protein
MKLYIVRQGNAGITRHLLVPIRATLHRQKNLDSVRLPDRNKELYWRTGLLALAQLAVEGTTVWE